MAKIKKKAKILIIEDDQFLAKMLGRILESTNFEIIMASSGQEGLRRANEQPDLIILDIILPDLDGFELLTRFKTDKAIKKIPILIISNLGQEEDIQRGLKLGAVDYIVKSDFSLNDVVSRVKKYIK